MSNIKLENIFKKYENSSDYAVSNLNIEIKDREFIAILGPSGCGKSTTLRLISGLEKITSGKIYIGNRLVNDIAPKDREVAMVFQNYALYPHMNVYNNIAFNLQLKKMDSHEIDIRVKKVVDMLELNDYIYKKPAELSGGQRQRVALARAIVRDAKLFLMDEPLSNLDAKLKNSTRLELAKLHRKIGATSILVTHDQAEAMSLASKIIIMNKGKVIQFDTPENIYENPKNLFVAEFIGIPKMNFIKGQFNSGFLTITRGNTIRLPAKITQKLNDFEYQGKDIIIGIRPSLISFANDNCSRFNLKDDLLILENTLVVYKEYQTNSIIYDIKWKEIELKIKSTVDVDTHSKNSFDLFVEHENIYIFDEKSGENINWRNI